MAEGSCHQLLAMFSVKVIPGTVTMEVATEIEIQVQCRSSLNIF